MNESMGCEHGNAVEGKMEWHKKEMSVWEYQLDHMDWWCVILDALWFEHAYEMQDVQAGAYRWSIFSPICEDMLTGVLM